jgi:chromosome segregation ATPase
MDDQIARLESKVLETIEIIQGLRQENHDLGSRVSDLEHQLQAAEEERNDLQRRLNDAQEMASRAELFEEKRRLVEQKVGGLLDKLEALG